MNRTHDVANLVAVFTSQMKSLGIDLQGIMIDHKSLMQLKEEAAGTAFLVMDPKYRTQRLKLGLVGVTAGDSTRQAP